jgi:hypothetical protein
MGGLLDKLMMGAAASALIVAAGWAYGRSQYHAGQLAAQLVDDQAGRKQDAVNDKRVIDAVTGYADRAAALKPIIVQSHDSEKIYAQSPAGNVLCRSPERVRDIDALEANLAPARAASIGAGAVQGDTAGSTP